VWGNVGSFKAQNTPFSNSLTYHSLAMGKRGEVGKIKSRYKGIKGDSGHGRGVTVETRGQHLLPGLAPENCNCGDQRDLEIKWARVDVWKNLHDGLIRRVYNLAGAWERGNSGGTSAPVGMSDCERNPGKKLS